MKKEDYYVQANSISNLINRPQFVESYKIVKESEIGTKVAGILVVTLIHLKLQNHTPISRTLRMDVDVLECNLTPKEMTELHHEIVTELLIFTKLDHKCTAFAYNNFEWLLDLLNTINNTGEMSEPVILSVIAKSENIKQMLKSDKNIITCNDDNISLYNIAQNYVN